MARQLVRQDGEHKTYTLNVARALPNAYPVLPLFNYMKKITKGILCMPTVDGNGIGTPRAVGLGTF
jgi:hypothetical protein